MTRFYITTPLYYVNAPPHLGHAYTQIVTDCVARYRRLCGDDVFFLTGTDEHGQKIATAAQAEGMSPQAFVDRMIQPFQALWRTLDISYDDFIRTTEPRHVRAVQAALQQLHDAGLLTKSTYTGWYCVPCESYWTAADVASAPAASTEKRCLTCQRPVEALEEDGYDLRLSGEATASLLAHVRAHPDAIQPDTRRNEILSLLERPLPEMLCVTRPKARVPWGIDVPFDREHVAYVWVDALINYITAVGFGADDRRLARYWPADVHVIGKDILRHHALYWPVLLRALGLPPPRVIVAHGWWKTGELKMSKSLGNVVDPVAVVKVFGVDAFRYFLLREVPFGQDGVFKESALVTRFNSELANDIGNLLHRTLTMVDQYHAGRVPDRVDGEATAVEQELARLRRDLPSRVETAMRCYDFAGTLGSILAVTNRANKAIEERAPWQLAKAGQAPAIAHLLWELMETLRVTTLALWPFIPRAAERMWSQLGYTQPLWQRGAIAWQQRVETEPMPAGQRTRKGEPLFPRRDVR